MLRFAYRLALRLGWVDVRAMLRSISSEQFMEWEAFAELEPFGEDREDVRVATIARTIANVNRDPKVRPTAYPVEMFIPSPHGDAHPPPSAVKSLKQDWMEMKAIALMAAASYGVSK